MENTLCHPTKEIITIGSDGLVHLAKQVAACAWMIHDSDKNFAKACFLLSHISSLSFYYSELKGIFRSLKHVEYLNLTPSEIHQYCDNEAAMDKCMDYLWDPKSMIQPDADILLAIHTIRRMLRMLRTRGTKVTCCHIYSPQNTRTPRTPTIFTEPTASDYHHRLTTPRRPIDWWTQSPQKWPTRHHLVRKTLPTQRSLIHQLQLTLSATNWPRRLLPQHYAAAPERISPLSSIIPSLATVHSSVSGTGGSHPTHAGIYYGSNKHIFYASTAMTDLNGTIAHLIRYPGLSFGQSDEGAPIHNGCNQAR